MLSIVIPTYNEKNNLVPLISKIAEALSGTVEYELVFVDDSSDDTPQVLAELSLKYPYLKYLHRTDERGLASAVVRGFEMASGEVLAVMDADLQHPPELLATMYAEIEKGADFVLPSRYVEGGQDEGLNFYRKFFSVGAKMAGKVLLKSLRKVSDPTSGFFMIKKEVIEGAKLRPTGWKILMEVLVMGEYENVVEVPYEFHKRNADESKMSLKVTLQYFVHILSLIARSENERRFYVFALIGLLGVAVDMAMFKLMTMAGISSVNLAATISAYTAMVVNYFFNRNVTWKKHREDTLWLQFIKYVLVCSVGIGVKNIFVLLLATVYGVPDMWSNFIGIIASCLFNYFLSDRWVFKGGKKSAGYSKPQ